MVSCAGGRRAHLRFDARAAATLGIRARDLDVLLTPSSLVAAINSMVAGAAVALAGRTIENLSAGWAFGLGALIAAVLYLAHERLAIHQYNLKPADLR